MQQGNGKCLGQIPGKVGEKVSSLPQAKFPTSLTQSFRGGFGPLPIGKGGIVSRPQMKTSKNREFSCLTFFFLPRFAELGKAFFGKEKKVGARQTTFGLAQNRS